MNEFHNDTRGQLFSIETAIGIAGVLLVIFIISQVIAFDPLTESTEQSTVDSEAVSLGERVLDTATQQNQIRGTLLEYDVSDEEFDSIGGETFTGPPDTEFGDTLSILIDSGYNFNVNVNYPTETGEIEQHSLISQGTPPESSIRLTEQIILFNEDSVSNDQGTLSEVDSDGTVSYIFPRSGEYETVYTTLQIEVIIW